MNESTPASNPDRRDSRWVERVRVELDERADGLDAQTLSRLNRARQSALAVAPGARTRRWLWTTLMGAAMTAALVLGIGLRPLVPTQPDASPEVSVSAQDFDLLASDDNLDLFQEDPDFYAWVDQDAAGPSGS